MTQELRKNIGVLNTYIDDPTEGLPEDIFLFATSITPMVNVDLLIRDEKGRILLSWRDDEIEGTGWHVPGGVIRLKESFEDRVRRTSQKEIGCVVDFKDTPLEIVPIIKKHAKIRCHFITFVYDCRLPYGFEIMESKQEGKRQAGELKWFDDFPSDMLIVHNFYRKYFNN